MELMKFSWQTSKLRTNVYGRSCNHVNHRGSTVGRWKLYTVTVREQVSISKSRQNAHETVARAWSTTLYFTSFIRSFVGSFIHWFNQSQSVRHSFTQFFMPSFLHLLFFCYWLICPAILPFSGFVCISCHGIGISKIVCSFTDAVNLSLFLHLTEIPTGL